MMRTWKNRRFLAILVSLVMMISMVPMQVLAASPRETISEAGTYTFNGAVTDEINVQVAGVTLVLDGAEISTSSGAAITSSHDLIINVMSDSSITSTDTSEPAIKVTGALTINGTGNLIVKNESSGVAISYGSFSTSMNYRGWNNDFEEYSETITIGETEFECGDNPVSAIQFTPSSSTQSKIKHIFSEAVDGGTISLGGVVGEYVTALKGTEMEIELIPESGYQLIDLRLDGANLMKYVDGNSYVLNVLATQKVKATFEKIPMPTLAEALADGLYAEDASGLYPTDTDWDALELVTNEKALESLTYLLLAAEVDVEGFDFGAIMNADADLPVTMGDFAEALNLVRSAITGEDVAENSDTEEQAEETYADGIATPVAEAKEAAEKEMAEPTSNTNDVSSTNAVESNTISIDSTQTSIMDSGLISADGIGLSQTSFMDSGLISADGIGLSQTSFMDSGAIPIGSGTSLVDSGILRFDTSLISTAEDGTDSVASAQGSYETATMESFMIPVSSLVSTGTADFASGVISLGGNASMYFNLLNDVDQNSIYQFYGDLISTQGDRLILNGDGAISGYITGYAMDTSAVNVNLGYMVILVDKAFGVDEDFAEQVAKGETAIAQGEFFTTGDLEDFLKSTVVMHGDANSVATDSATTEVISKEVPSGSFDLTDNEESLNATLNAESLKATLNAETGGGELEFSDWLVNKVNNDYDEAKIADSTVETAISGISFRGFATLVGSEIGDLTEGAMYAIVSVGDEDDATSSGVLDVTKPYTSSGGSSIFID